MIAIDKSIESPHMIYIQKGSAMSGCWSNLMSLERSTVFVIKAMTVPSVGLANLGPWLFSLHYVMNP